MNVIEKDTKNVIQRIYIYILLSSTGAFYEKMVIFELILNNSFRYPVMVQAKMIVLSDKYVCKQ